MEVKDVICPFCGCLCDDLKLTVEEERIIKTGKACSIGNSLFLNHNTDLASPGVNGSPVSLEKAIDQAVTILTGAQHPLIYGLSSASCEAQRKAIELAEILGGEHRQYLLCLSRSYSPGLPGGRRGHLHSGGNQKPFRFSDLLGVQSGRISPEASGPLLGFGPGVIYRPGS